MEPWRPDLVQAVPEDLFLALSPDVPMTDPTSVPKKRNPASQRTCVEDGYIRWVCDFVDLKLLQQPKGIESWRTFATEIGILRKKWVPNNAAAEIDSELEKRYDEDYKKRLGDLASHFPPRRRLHYFYLWCLISELEIAPQSDRAKDRVEEYKRQVKKKYEEFLRGESSRVLTSTSKRSSDAELSAPSKAPATLHEIHGRDKELKEIHNFAIEHCAKQFLVFLCPEGVPRGTGKTYLASEAATSLQSSNIIDPRGEFQKLDLTQQNGEHLKAVSEIDLVSQLLMKKNVKPEGTADLRKEQYNDLFRPDRPHRIGILLLDDAWDDRQVKALLPRHPCAVFVTCIQRLELGDYKAPVLRLRIGPLAVEASKKYLRDAYKGSKAPEEENLSLLAASCGYIPYFLYLARKQLIRWDSEGVSQSIAKKLDGLTKAIAGNQMEVLKLIFDCLDHVIQSCLQQSVGFLVPFTATDFDGAFATSESEGKLLHLVSRGFLQSQEINKQQFFSHHAIMKTFLSQREPKRFSEYRNRTHFYFLEKLKEIQILEVEGKANEAVQQLKRYIDGIKEAAKALEPELVAKFVRYCSAYGVFCSGMLYDEKRKLFASAKDILDKSTTSKLLEKLAADALYGAALEQCEEFDEAERMLRNVEEHFQHKIDPQHPDRGSALSNLGLIYRARNEYDNARKCYEEAQKIFAQPAKGSERLNIAPNPINISLWTALNNLGLVYQDLGRLSDALNNFSMAAQSTVSCSSRNQLMVLNNLATTHLLLGHVDDAREFVVRAIALGYEPLNFVALSLKARYLLAEHRSDKRAEVIGEAEALQRDALLQNEKYYGEQHWKCGIAHILLAEIFHQKGSLQDAENHCQRGIDIFERKGKHSPAVEKAKGYIVRGDIYLDQDQPRCAYDMYCRALNLDLGNPEHYVRIRAKQGCQTVQEKLHR